MINSQNKVISFGAGVNTVAMTILLYREAFRFPIVFSDTGAEHAETYSYLDFFDSYLREKFSAQIIRLSYREEQYFKHNDRLSLEEYCLAKRMIPSLNMRWCAKIWKREPLEQYRKRMDNSSSLLIGFSGEETKRMNLNSKFSNPWEFPLIERNIWREDCLRIIKEEGLEIPRKSFCFFCPFQKLSQWRTLFEKNPDLWERAKTLEKIASERVGRKITFRMDNFSLQEMEDSWKSQLELFSLKDYSVYKCFFCGL